MTAAGTDASPRQSLRGTTRGTGDWHLFTAIFDNKHSEIYVDGYCESSGKSPGTNSLDGLTIGCDHAGVFFLTGSVAEVRPDPTLPRHTSGTLPSPPSFPFQRLPSPSRGFLPLSEAFFPFQRLPSPPSFLPPASPTSQLPASPYLPVPASCTPRRALCVWPG